MCLDGVYYRGVDCGVLADAGMYLEEGAVSFFLLFFFFHLFLLFGLSPPLPPTLLSSCSSPLLYTEPQDPSPSTAILAIESIYDFQLLFRHLLTISSTQTDYGPRKQKTRSLAFQLVVAAVARQFHHCSPSHLRVHRYYRYHRYQRHHQHPR